MPEFSKYVEYYKKKTLTFFPGENIEFFSNFVVYQYYFHLLFTRYAKMIHQMRKFLETFACKSKMFFWVPKIFSNIPKMTKYSQIAKYACYNYAFLLNILPSCQSNFAWNHFFLEIF